MDAVTAYEAGICRGRQAALESGDEDRGGAGLLLDPTFLEDVRLQSHPNHILLMELMVWKADMAKEGLDERDAAACDTIFEIAQNIIRKVHESTLEQSQDTASRELAAAMTPLSDACIELSGCLRAALQRVSVGETLGAVVECWRGSSNARDCLVDFDDISRDFQEIFNIASYYKAEAAAGEQPRRQEEEGAAVDGELQGLLGVPDIEFEESLALAKARMDTEFLKAVAVEAEQARREAEHRVAAMEEAAHRRKEEVKRLESQLLAQRALQGGAGVATFARCMLVLVVIVSSLVLLARTRARTLA